MGNTDAVPNYQALDWPIEALNLPPVTENALLALRLQTVRDVATKTEVWLCMRKGIGRKGLQTIKDVLQAHNLHLGW